MDFVKMHEQNKRKLVNRKNQLLSKKEKLSEELELVKMELDEIEKQESVLDKKFKAFNSDYMAYEEILTKISPRRKVEVKSNDNEGGSTATLNETGNEE